MKHALITGTASGIGLALTRQLLGMGCQVHGIGRRSPTLEQRANYRHLFCDLSNTGSASADEEIAHFLAEKKELTRFDLVVLNAGQFCAAMRRVSDTPLDEIIRLFQLNCVANKTILDSLYRAGIDVPLCAVSASIAGHRARAGNGGYAISKAALSMMMALYALEHPDTFFAVLGLCAVNTSLGVQVSTLPLPDDPVFADQARLRSRLAGSGYVVTPEARANHLISLLLPERDPRIQSGKFVEIRELV
jgi:benzil reductase ((S)-benzoin forming)